MTRKLTQEEFEEKFYTSLGKDYVLLSSYEGMAKKVTIHHKTCGNTYEQLPHTIIYRGYGCPKCGAIKGRKSRWENYIPKKKERKPPRDYFQERVNNTRRSFKGEYEYIETLDKYYCIMLHVDCGSLYKCHYRNMQKRTALNQRCPKCFPKVKTRDSKGFSLKVPNDYKLLSPYVNMKTKVKVEHSCGTVFKTNPDNLMRGKSGCPSCKGSSGELYIADFLSSLSIPFEREKTFEGLVSNKGNPLRYDFFFHYKGKDILLEVNGKQHYAYVPFFHTYEDFLKGVASDEKKKDYAKSKGFVYIEVKYDELATFVNAGGDSLDVYVK